MNQKIQKWILFSLIVILSGLALMLVSFMREKDSNTPFLSSDNFSLLSHFTKREKKEKIRPSELIKISSNEVVTYTLLGSGGNVVYFDAEGRLGLTDYIGAGRDEVTFNIGKRLLRGLWSPKKLEVILFIRDDFGQLGKIFYNYNTGEVALLDKNIQNVDFSPDGENIAYNFFDEETYEGNISISNVDGSSFVNVLNTRLSDIAIYWIQDDLISFHKVAGNGEKVDLLSINREGDRLQKLLTSKENLEVNWSPNGNNFLFSEETEGNSRLYYRHIDDVEEEETELDLDSTADDCVWSQNNTTIFCLSDGKLYKLNVLDGAKEKLYKFGIDVQIKNPKLTPLEDYFLFINNEDGGLYSLILR